MTGQVALITGGTAGIGFAIAELLGRHGYRVAITSRSQDRVDAALVRLQAAGVEATGTAADVSNANEVAHLVSTVEATSGPVDVLVNNAGVAIIRPFEELSLDDWDTTMATNLRGLFLMTQAVLPSMRRRESGAIINIASLAGRNGFKGGTAYAASKHAVLGFTRSLMLEVRAQGIRVAALCPGSVDTELLHSEPMIAPNEGAAILQPSDVADAVLAVLRLPPRALISELDLRPTNP